MMRHARLLRLSVTCRNPPIVITDSDGRADGTLASAHALLLRRAEKIGDECLRRRFLGDLVVNRTILQACETRTIDGKRESRDS